MKITGLKASLCEWDFREYLRAPIAIVRSLPVFVNFLLPSPGNKWGKILTWELSFQGMKNVAQTKKIEKNRNSLSLLSSHTIVKGKNIFPRILYKHIYVLRVGINLDVKLRPRLLRNETTRYGSSLCQPTTHRIGWCPSYPKKLIMSKSKWKVKV